VLSSLVLHHLTADNKRRTLQEVVRVLRPGGGLYVVDFGKPHTAWGRLLAPVIWRLEQASDNVAGRLPEMFRQAGLVQVDESIRFATVFGTLSLLQGRKPD
jgi:ubiquinone/menaquinone biosynthesis C-methylase UbiE